MVNGKVAMRLGMVGGMGMIGREGNKQMNEYPIFTALLFPVSTLPPISSIKCVHLPAPTFTPPPRYPIPLLLVYEAPLCSPHVSL